MSEAPEFSTGSWESLGPEELRALCRQAGEAKAFSIDGTVFEMGRITHRERCRLLGALPLGDGVSAGQMMALIADDGFQKTFRIIEDAVTVGGMSISKQPKIWDEEHHSDKFIAFSIISLLAYLTPFLPKGGGA